MTRESGTGGLLELAKIILQHTEVDEARRLVTFQMFRFGDRGSTSRFRPMLMADKFSHSCSPSDTFGETFKTIFPQHVLTSSSMLVVLSKGINLAMDPEATFQNYNISNSAVLNVVPKLDVATEYSCCDIDD